MHVTVQQKSIRHKSSRMYHGVYTGRRRRRSENNDSTSEGERAEERGGERASEEASKAFISVALFYFFVRPFVRSTIFSTLGAFSTEWSVSEGGPVEVAQLAGTAGQHWSALGRRRVKGRRRLS